MQVPSPEAPAPEAPPPAAESPSVAPAAAPPQVAAPAKPAPSVSAGTWGDLRARFVFDGPPPERKPVQVTADIEFCGKQEILEENLVVHPGNRGVANVVLWLYQSLRDPAPPVRADNASARVTDVVLDAKGCRFEPHICLLRTDQTLVIRNENPIGDSAKIDTLSNPGVNILLPVGGEIRQQFRQPERSPAFVSCTVHPWEAGWLIVSRHPHMGVSDRDGKFELKDVPTGKWTFQVWHEKAGYVSQLTLRGEPVQLARGRLTLDIQTGDNDLGEVRLPPAVFRK